MTEDTFPSPLADDVADANDGEFASKSAGDQAASGPQHVQAIRVAVKRSVRDGELFVARLLDKQAAPAGSHEAFLVLTDPNVDLFVPS
jgi:hypothetical protein